MLTPEGTSPIASTVPERPLVSSACVGRSASPLLHSTCSPTMKRTPQPTLTQSKLTSLLQAKAKGPSDVPDGGDPGVDARRTLTLEDVEMESAAIPPPASGPPQSAPPAHAPGQYLTTDLFLKTLKEHTDQIIMSFNANINALSHRIDDNAGKIAANSSAIASQVEVADTQQSIISRLETRVSRLEKRSQNPVDSREERATLSPDYLFARRSVRLWPITGTSQDDMWGSVGEFLHETLLIRTDDLGQGDIESIERVREDPMVDRREVIVTFFTKDKRDLVVTSSPSLSSKIDREGKPTAGIRLEIPEELTETFRLLSRFGTRLRARHGAGTKRHIKFDDFRGTLFTNVKLPGDNTWTRVTVSMAREDLAASIREENVSTQKRLATKLLPGPRERLGRPMIPNRGIPVGRLALGDGTSTTATNPAPGPAIRQPPGGLGATLSAAGPSGKRPRWTGPDRPTL